MSGDENALRRPWQAVSGPECGDPYDGRWWAPLPCVKPHGHPRSAGHADWYGRTWQTKRVSGAEVAPHRR